MDSELSPKRNTRSQSGMRRTTAMISYTILAVMAIAMLLPLLWLVNGSFQEAWQINADPVIWIPRHWQTILAGDTGRQLLLYWMTTPDGEREQVTQIGARRYTTLVDATKLEGVSSVPRDQLSEAVPSELNGIPVNVRTWSSPTGEVQAVALARDPNNEENLIIVELSALEGLLSQAPLDQANKGERASLPVAGTELEGRTLEDGRTYLVIGPESEMAVVGSPSIVENAELVQTNRLSDKEFIDVGTTQLATYAVEGKPEGERYVPVVQENWQPLMEQSLLAEKAFVVREEDLSEEKEIQQINGLNMNVRTYTPPEGGEPYPVAILTPGSIEFLVLPVEEMDQLYAGPISELIEPGSVNISTLTYRVQEDFEKEGKIVPSAFVGEIQDLSLIVPADVVQNAFDVSPDQLERSTKIRLTSDGYKKVLGLKLAGTPFWRFFVNSGYVVLMNMIGHFVSCTLVAYGFARFRAPGKDILFVILLGTMMVPYTIVTLPTYLVFRELGLLGTMVPLWIRSFFGNAFLIFILRQFFMSIPYELDEAAILDGANRLQVLIKVIIPLSKPALATLGIFTFWWYWNAFLDPLIYINQQRYYTITLAMKDFSQLYSRSAGYYDRILAGSVLSLLPMVIIFLFAQRYFIEGIQLQGLKR